MRSQGISRNWIVLLSIVVVGLMVACTCKLPTPISQAKPTVAIIAPADGAEFAVGQTIDVQVLGGDTQGVRRLELLANGGPVDAVSSPSPQPSLNATLRWAPSTAGRHALAVIAYNVDDTASDPAIIAVSVVDSLAGDGASGSSTVPTIHSFTASPLTIDAGASSTLSWEVADATSVEIDQGIGTVPASGSQGVSPASTTTYQLTARGPGGDATATVQVTVNSAGAAVPAILSFTASPATIDAGGSSTLKWEVTGATTVEIDQGVGAVTPSGSRTVKPASTTTYQLTARGPGGDVSATAQVTVKAGAPPGSSQKPVIQSFTASPATIDAGGSSTLQWAVTGATSVEIDHGVGAVNASGSRGVSPASTSTYQLTARGPGGDATATVQVTVRAAAAAPRVVSPNGGETWARGQSYTIQWTGFTGTQVKIELHRGPARYTIASATNNDGSHVHTVSPEAPWGTNYRVKVTSLSDPAQSDTSDGDFTIPAVVFSPRVAYPNGGETWTQGQTYTIRWSGFTGERVAIGLHQGLGPVGQIIASSTNNSGSYAYTVPDDTALATNYRVKVISLSDRSQSDTSDNDFTIRAAAPSPTPLPPPRVTQPSGGEFRHGQIVVIRWENFTGAQVKIELFKTTLRVGTINASTENDGSYDWKVPNGLELSSSYRVRITSLSDPTQRDFSDNYFSVVASPRVVSPNGGETWTRGQTRTIQWTGFTGTYVTIGLYRGSTMVRAIATSTNNDGSHSWQVPGDLPPGSNYRVRISSLTATAQSDSSNNSFTIQ